MSTPPGQTLPPAPSLSVGDNPPRGWEQQALSSMRVASYLVKGPKGASTDVSLVVLPGSAGGPLDNVNRWLAQLSQPEISQAALDKMAQHVTSPLGDVTVVDLTGLPPGADPAKDGRIVAGMILRDGQTFFFKMRGNAELTEAQKPAFLKWMASVREASPPASAAASSPVPESPMETPSNQAAAKWEVPSSWKPAPGQAMRYASFAVTGGNGESADISVVVLPGEAGSDLDNVNRWRSQIGLEAVAPDALAKMLTEAKSKSGPMQWVDMSGPKARVLAAWLRRGGQTWFFKMSGPDSLVAAHRREFTDFLGSVEIP